MSAGGESAPAHGVIVETGGPPVWFVAFLALLTIGFAFVPTGDDPSNLLWRVCMGSLSACATIAFGIECHRARRRFRRHRCIHCGGRGSVYEDRA